MHGLGARGRGVATTAHYLKNAAQSSGANSRQMLPSTTDTKSALRVRVAKVFRSADSKKLIFICALPASFKAIVESATFN